MPSGLDGNPNPIATSAREGVLAAVLAKAGALRGERILIGIDGRAGTGKSTFADELAVRLSATGACVVRSTTDSFHRPRAERMQLGPTSAEGYYLDSHQLDVMVSELFEPFAAGASQVLVSAFDEPTDSPAFETAVLERAATLVFDGLFLQRPELHTFWDVVVFLDADRRLDDEWNEYLLSGLPQEPSTRAAALDERLVRARWPRYRAGWTGYVERSEPRNRATFVIDNNDLAAPRLIQRPDGLSPPLVPL